MSQPQRSAREQRRLTRIRNTAHAEALAFMESIDAALASEDARYEVASLLVQAREAGYEEGRQSGLDDGYESGYRYGFDVGYNN